MLTDKQIMLQRPDTFAAWATRDYYARHRFQLFRHVELMATEITNAIREGSGRLIINMPPQHGKSFFLSRWVPPWFLECFPWARVIMASYSNPLITDHSRYVRDLLEANPSFETTLRQDTRKANQWNTHLGGGMLATTIKGSVSGFPGDLMLIDDPYKGWREAWSPTVRRDVQNWFDAELYARKQENATIIVLHTRWHPKDLTGYLLNDHEDDWRHIKLPAICNDPDDLLGREIGEALCPELHTAESFGGSMKNRAIWEAVWQQDPTGLGEGRAYGEFTGRNIDETVELVDGLPIDLSMDFNLRPGMHATVGQHITAQDLITAVDEFHEHGMTLIELLDAFIEWYTDRGGSCRFPEVRIFGDASGHSGDMSTSNSCYDMVKLKLGRAGIPYRVRVPRKAPGIRDSLDDVNAALRGEDDGPRYLIHPRCERLIRDYSEVGTDEKGKPDKANPDLTHASDGERYRITRIRPISRLVETGVNRVGF